MQKWSETDVHTVLSGSAASQSARDRAEARHIVQFYESAAFPAASVAEYLSTGIKAGDSAVLVMVPEHLARVREALANDGAPLDALVRSGRLVARDARETLDEILVDGVPEPSRFEACVGLLIGAATAGSPSGSVRVFGECVALLAQKGDNAGSVALERLWNRMLQKHAFSLYCAYPLQEFASLSQVDSFRCICDEHDAVVPVLTALDTPARHPRCIAILQQQARALSVEIEERRRGEARLAVALQKLAEADRRKDEFLAMLGHELRNPLAPITTAVELMELRGDPSCQRERAVIRRQAAHLKRLVDDLLDIARITRGKIELHREFVQIATVITKAVELASPAIERHAHALVVDVPRGGLAVHGDPTRLCQIFANLICNAATYTSSGGQISVGARREGDMVVVAVTDNGRGIAPSIRPYIFDLFVQGDRPLDRPQGGLGLGLALVKIFTELHGGTVSVESGGGGQGSTFTVCLPALPALDADEATDPPFEPAPRPQRPGARVLIVDDNEDAIDLLAETLRGAGYEIAVAHDGPEALLCVATSTPEVAVIDIGLPVMDGYELAARLRADHPASELRLIALTGYGQESDRERSRRVGFDLHLVKPIDLTTLMRAISAPPPGAPRS